MQTSIIISLLTIAIAAVVHTLNQIKKQQL